MWHFLSFLGWVLFSSVVFAGDGHDHGNRQMQAKEQGQKQAVELSIKGGSLAGVRTKKVVAAALDYEVYAPGEVKATGYRSYLVSPRLDSVVLKRYVTLGEHVKKGQLLVSLFSEAMVDEQANYLLALSAWQRLAKLGGQTVGEEKLTNAKTAFAAAKARLLAFGLSSKSIELLNLDEHRLGEYQLNAAIDGAVLSDDFHQGQRVEAGQSLLTLVDETSLWLDANLPANTNLKLPIGTKARVLVAGVEVMASVSQAAHTIDPHSRTRIVRLALDNPADRFHAGMFADVYFRLTTDKSVIAVPQRALNLSADQHWQVFVMQSTGHFVPREVEVVGTFGQMSVVEGLQAGDELVVDGAFFVASEQAKSGFDPHNH